MKCILTLLLLLCLLSLFAEVESRKRRNLRRGRNGRDGIKSGSNEHGKSRNGNGEQATACPDGWIIIPELRRCYWVETTPTTYDQAQAICRIKGGTLWTNQHKSSDDEESEDTELEDEEETGDMEGDGDKLETEEELEGDNEEEAVELGEEEDDHEDEEENVNSEEESEEDEELEEEKEEKEEEDNEYNNEEAKEEGGEEGEKEGETDKEEEEEEEVGDEDGANGKLNSNVEEDEDDGVDNDDDDEEDDDDNDQEDEEADPNPMCAARVLQQHVLTAVNDALASFTHVGVNEREYSNVKQILDVIADIVSDHGVSGSIVDEALQPVIDAIAARSQFDRPNSEPKDGAVTRKRRHIGSRAAECWFGENGGQVRSRELCLEAFGIDDGKMTLQWTRCDKALAFVCQTDMYHPTEDHVQGQAEQQDQGQNQGQAQQQDQGKNQGQGQPRDHGQDQGPVNGGDQGQGWRRWGRYWARLNMGGGRGLGEGRYWDGDYGREGRNRVAPWIDGWRRLGLGGRRDRLG